MTEIPFSLGRDSSENTSEIFGNAFKVDDMQRINYGAVRAKATDTRQGGTKQDGRRALTQPPCSLQGQSCCSCCSSTSPCTVLQVSHLMGHRRRSGLGVPSGDVLLGSLGKKPQ